MTAREQAMEDNITELLKEVARLKQQVAAYQEDRLALINRIAELEEEVNTLFI